MLGTKLGSFARAVNSFIAEPAPQLDINILRTQLIDMYHKRKRRNTSIQKIEFERNSHFILEGDKYYFSQLVISFMLVKTMATLPRSHLVLEPNGRPG